MNRFIRSVIAWVSSLRHISLLAIIPATGHAHWALATTLGYPAWLAPAIPVAVDAYVLAAFRAWESRAMSPAGKARGSRMDRVRDSLRGSDLLWAIALDCTAVAGSNAVSHLTLTEDQKAFIGGGLGVILVLVLWRVHAVDVQVRMGSRQAQAKAAQAKPKVQPAPIADPLPTPAEVAQVAHDDGGEVAQEVSTLVAVTGPVDLERWVTRQFAAGAQRAEVLRVGAARFGVSESTVKRRWSAEMKSIPAQQTAEAAR